MGYDRDYVLNESEYQFDNTKKQSDHTSKKSWWVIGILIGLVMNFIAFLIFHSFHAREHNSNNYLNNL